VIPRALAVSRIPRLLHSRGSIVNQLLSLVRRQVLILRRHSGCDYPGGRTSIRPAE